jgi:folylpolyglutamate synthase/dihydrofolate synthase
MINLGLKRIVKLLDSIGNPQLAGWSAVHVAGTNGKGSVCAYISSVINEANIPNARFNSPHLVDYWDCIQINGKPIDRSAFVEIEKRVVSANRDHNIGATSFEILTAIAYESFKRSNVEIAVVETGMGGRLDSTNVLNPDHVLATVITKIGLDHEGFLGGSLEEIASHKAGIIKSRVPCIVDGTNSQSVLDIVRKEANQKNSLLVMAGESSYFPLGLSPPHSPLLGSYQASNLACAWNALHFVQRKYPQKMTEKVIEKGIQNTQWPGRLQWAKIGKVPVLLDGAHNPQSATLLNDFVTENIRTNQTNILYIIAFTKGKDFSQIIDILVRPGDRVVCTQFGPVDGMPWIEPEDSHRIAEHVKLRGGTVTIAADPAEAVNYAEHNTVICGSLYLVGDVLRNLRQQNH